MTNYRNNCFDPKTLRSFYSLPTDLMDNVTTLCIDAKYYDEEHFHQWIAQWKSLYKFISELSNGVKKDHSVDNSIRDSGVAAIAKLANTLINARQFLLDQRRATRHPRTIH